MSTETDEGRKRQVERWCEQIDWGETGGDTLVSTDPLVIRTWDGMEIRGQNAEVAVALTMLRQYDRAVEESKPVQIRRTNLRDALMLAMTESRRIHGYESGQEAGWREVLRALESGKQIVVAED